jgi:NAD(P)-dependent dehydrogenase (short-subunit alcohol dehydrogenase family)
MNVRRIAVVTGANRGIGFEIARQLVLSGLDVVAASRDATQGRDAASRIGARWLPLDVSDPSSIESFARELDDKIDVLVNNAGIALQGFDANVARRTVDVNFFGALNLTERLVPRLRSGARIVMVSSGMGELTCVSDALRRRFSNPALTRQELGSLIESFVRDVVAGSYRQNGWPGSAYRVSKVGLNALTRVVARELEGDPRRILVNAACPGWVRTDMGGPSASRSPEKGAETPVWLALLPDGGKSGGFFRDKGEIAW